MTRLRDRAARALAQFAFDHIASWRYRQDVYLMVDRGMDGRWLTGEFRVPECGSRFPEPED